MQKKKKKKILTWNRYYFIKHIAFIFLSASLNLCFEIYWNFIYKNSENIWIDNELMRLICKDKVFKPL